MEGSPNLLSYLVDFLWVPAVLLLLKRGPVARSTAIAVMAGILLLPELLEFKLPGVPAFRKQDIISTWIFVGIVWFHRDRIASVRLTRGQKLSVAGLTLGVLTTILLNRDVLKFGPTVLPAHELYDTVHYVAFNISQVIIPFAIGAAVFRSARELRVLLVTMVTAMLLYSVLQIAELRLSPQFHRWVYGFHQHSFAQTMREGGFRPMVFMSHGLAVSLLTAVAAIASLGLYRAKQKVGRISGLVSGGYLWLVLMASKSVAAFVYSLVAGPIVMFTSPKIQARLAALFCAFVLAYPVIRAADLIPVDDIREVVESRWGLERADSAMTRFENEERLLKRARERLAFGWGSFCRPCTFDPYSGKEVSIRDGDWIISMGDWGAVGFVSKFLFLMLPVFRLRKLIVAVPTQIERRLLSTTALIVAFYALDLLPNGNYHILPFVLCGALHGATNGILRQAAVARYKRRVAHAHGQVDVELPPQQVDVQVVDKK